MFDLKVRTASNFEIHILFRGQRFKSKPFPCVCEPKINETFLLELHKDGHMMADKESLLSICDRIHLVMVKIDSSNDDVVLISSTYIDWRTNVLCSQSSKHVFSLELMGTGLFWNLEYDQMLQMLMYWFFCLFKGSESKVPVGILNISMQLVPMLDANEHLNEDILTTQLGLEHSRNTERERLFLVYAKQWWKEYLEIRDDHKNRFVKIFAQVNCLCDNELIHQLDRICMALKGRKRVE
jgi:centrosomal protein CEP76